jgi:hypothetical protein
VKKKRYNKQKNNTKEIREEVIRARELPLPVALKGCTKSGCTNWSSSILVFFFLSFTYFFFSSIDKRPTIIFQLWSFPSAETNGNKPRRPRACAPPPASHPRPGASPPVEDKLAAPLSRHPPSPISPSGREIAAPICWPPPRFPPRLLHPLAYIRDLRDRLDLHHISPHNTTSVRALGIPNFVTEVRRRPQLRRQFRRR